MINYWKDNMKLFIKIFIILLFNISIFYSCSKESDENPVNPTPIYTINVYTADYYNDKFIHDSNITIDDNTEAEFYSISDGCYRVNGVTKGSHKLHATPLSHYPKTINITVNNNNQVFTITMKPKYRFSHKWGSAGTGPGQFDVPEDIAIDRSLNHIYVGDSVNNRIQKFDSIGNYLGKMTNGSINGVTGVAFFNNHVYSVAAHQLIVFDFLDNGTYNQSFAYTSGAMDLVGFGSYLYLCTVSGIAKVDLAGTLITNYASLFSSAHRIAVDSSGNFYTANYGTLKKFNNSMNLVFNFGYHCWWTQGVAVDNSGFIYSTDGWHKWICKYDSNGNVIARWGNNYAVDENIGYPKGIDIDSNGNVYVCSTSHNDIKVFAPSSE